MPSAERIVHADWSRDPRKRWAASASREGEVWRVGSPFEVDAARLVDDLFAGAGPVLAGFDFPIGAPRCWGERTGLGGFRALLDALGTPPWQDFAKVCETAGEISLHRPFYPQRPGGTSQDALVKAHGVACFDDLRRDCERGGDGRRAACPLFWTLGGNQVGKAALSGWTEILRPALARGAALWPFDGDIATLLARGGVVLAETYPADALATLATRPQGRFSKRRSTVRAALAGLLSATLGGLPVVLEPEAAAALADGFGPRAAGEDAFDAFIGLLAMIVTLKHRAHSVGDPVWEGGILGRHGGRG